MLETQRRHREEAKPTKRSSTKARQSNFSPFFRAAGEAESTVLDCFVASRIRATLLAMTA